MLNAFTIDVEDWFQVEAFAPVIRRSSWPTLPCRVEHNVEMLLAVLERRKVGATFFMLGWIAERYPRLVREIVDAGHEIANHGYAHKSATDQSPAEFREDLVCSKAVLEDLTGSAVRGYRAPCFSIGRTNLWAHDVVAQTGHAYSSSIYPIRHDLYGMPGAPRFPYRASNGLLEIPPTSIRLFGKNFPAAGGGFFRLLPYPVSAWAVRRVNTVDEQAAIFYCHPWEIDPQQPRVHAASLKSRFRHYVNLELTMSRIDRLLQEFRWARMDQVFAAQLNAH